MKDNYEKIRRLMLASNQMDGGYYLFARKAGIRENTLALLYALDDGHPHSQKQVCEEWLIPKTTINTVVRELLRKDYITLGAAGPTKEKTILLTQRGRQYADEIMEEIVRAKIDQNPAVKERLLETGDIIIEEGNDWKDTYWGVDLKTGKGENHLGKILMKSRDLVRNKK